MKSSLLLFIFLPALINGHGCKGCVPLDMLTFDKMVNSFQFSLVKFDTAHPYGDKHEQFSFLAVDASPVENLLVGDVGIKDYGEPENVDLAERFAIRKNEWPAVLLFRRDSDGSLEHFRYRGHQFTSEAIKSFIKQHTGIVMAVSGTHEEFETLADQVFKVKEKKWPEILQQMKEKAGNITEPEEKKKADEYVNTMSNLMDKGQLWLKNEIQSTKQQMNAGHVKELERKRLRDKYNILKTFGSHAPPRIRDEL